MTEQTVIEDNRLETINKQIRVIVKGFGIKASTLAEKTLMSHSSVKIKILEQYPTDFQPHDIPKLREFFSELKKEIEVFESLTN